MSFTSIIVHFMITYTLYTLTNWISKIQSKPVYIRFLSRFFVTDGTFLTKLHDKRNDFDFHIVNLPEICSNIPESPAYGVYISQLIRYARACSSCVDFIDRGRQLTKKLVSQGYALEN